MPSSVYAAIAASRKAYEEIVEPTFGYPRHREVYSASLAAQLVDPRCEGLCRGLWILHDALRHSKACIATPAGACTGSHDVLLVADSAAREAAKAYTRGRHVVLVTDLDGGFEALTRLSQYALCTAVHAHGDNMWLHPFLPGLRARCLIVTTQVEVPRGLGVLGPLGYTDGDRAILLAMALGASRVEALWGGSPWAKAWGDPGVKALKLSVAKRLINVYSEALGYRCEWMPVE
ncbi:MAG: hypothetical protein GSR80_000512 [Desulfurococcales archaeon]|nr:hypothetical protein [Desulfurococcales archaeon]